MVISQEQLRKSDLRFIEEFILELLKAEGELQDLNWLDKITYAREQANPPVGTIFRIDKDHTLHSLNGGSQGEYEYTVTFRIELMVTRSDPDADEISWLEEKIEELIIKNQSPTNAQIGGMAHPIQMKVIRSDYDTLFDAHEAVDTLMMDVTMEYTREVDQ